LKVRILKTFQNQFLFADGSLARLPTSDVSRMFSASPPFSGASLKPTFCPPVSSAALYAYLASQTEALQKMETYYAKVIYLQ